MGSVEEAPIHPIRYEDPEYQEVHLNLFSKSLTRPLEAVLPPGVSREDFGHAITELKAIVGSKYVYTGNDLTEYVDPYELREASSERKVPSAAVWSVMLSILRATSPF